MSRIIVRNLPDQITKEKLQKLFSEKGHITDIQLKYTKDGKFRKFGFVGFKKPEQASAVIETFNKTFVNASQIQIELCAELADPNKPRSWSKHASDSSAFKTKHNENHTVDEEPDKKKKRKNKKIKDPEVEKLLKDHKDDPQFKDFLKSHLPGDDVLSELAKEEESGSDGEEKSKKNSENDIANKEISDLEYLQLKTGKKLKLSKSNENNESTSKYKLFTIKIKGLPPGTTKSEIKEFLKPVKPFNIRRAMKSKSIAYCTFKLESELKKALLKHRSFLGGKRIFVSISRSKEDETPSKENKWKEQEDRLKNEESVAESGRIFLRNLPYNATEEEITEIFQKFGPISEVILPIDSFTRLTKGFGIVTFLMPEHAVNAFNELDGTIFQGRMLHLLPGIASKSNEDDETNDGEGGDFKKKKFGKQKSQANSSTNWNTFFIGENTLAEAMASTYKTTKENVLDDAKSGTAVRLALGETQIVNQIQEFLEENEVCLESFSNLAKCPRSKNVILIKNLPFGTKIDEIREKFANYGELKRIILPPNGIAAIVEFIEPSEARKAFKSVAYSKFKHVPMYLEWAPEGVFSKTEKKKEEKVGEEKTPYESVDGAIVFVKNLNFSTDSNVLRVHFEKCGKIVSATVAERKDPKNPGKKLSMGYGFVEFETKEEADKALRDLQFSKLEEHTLELKRSNRSTKAEDSTVKKSANLKGKPSTKILVRNIPFQAKQKEVEQLFKVFGEVKSVRLPKKMVGSGSHRGFCFVEFHTIHDAKRAFKALSQSTHLYGRRLVLEWAETGDDVETLREKTKEQYAPSVAKPKTGKKTVSLEEVTTNKESESDSE